METRVPIPDSRATLLHIDVLHKNTDIAPYTYSCANGRCAVCTFAQEYCFLHKNTVSYTFLFHKNNRYRDPSGRRRRRRGPIDDPKGRVQRPHGVLDRCHGGQGYE